MNGNAGNNLFDENDRDGEAQKMSADNSQIPIGAPPEAGVKDSQIRRWTLIGLAITGCLSAVFCAFFFIDLGQLPLVARYFPSPTPTLTPIPTPTPLFEPITVIAHEDFSTDYPYLENLAPDWEHSPMLPSTVTSHVEVNRDQPVLVSRCWCTTTEEILAENLPHIEWLVEADGSPIDVDTLYLSKFVDTTTACKGYDGLVEQWSEGEHTIVLTMKIDQDINDGSVDFKAGDYVETFIINVTD